MTNYRMPNVRSKRKRTAHSCHSSFAIRHSCFVISLIRHSSFVIRHFSQSAFGRVLLTLAMLATIAAVAQACPTCGEGLSQSDPQHQSVAAGFYYSILFMMSVPYVVLASLCGLAYVAVRRARERQELVAEQTDDSPRD